MDLRMTNLTGLEVLKRLREERLHPVVIRVYQPYGRRIWPCVQALGASYFFTKPQYEKVIETIKQLQRRCYFKPMKQELQSWAAPYRVMGNDMEISHLWCFPRFRAVSHPLVASNSVIVLPTFSLLITAALSNDEWKKTAFEKERFAISQLAAANQENFINNARQLLATLTQFPFWS